MLKEGNQLPSLSLPDQNGKTFPLENLVGKPCVIFFYPKNETPGCVAEVCSFRDNYEDFVNIGATVVGISSDSVKSHAKFAKNRNLPYTLLSDKDRKAEKAFGVKRNFLGLVPGRVTFVFNSKGRIVHTFSSQTNPTQHIFEALKVLKG